MGSEFIAFCCLLFFRNLRLNCNLKRLLMRNFFQVFSGALFLAAPVFSADIAIDGSDADWNELGSNRWYDSQFDAGGNSRDLASFKLASNQTDLFIYAKFAEQYGDKPYPEINLFIDRDGRYRTGREGFEVQLSISA